MYYWNVETRDREAKLKQLVLEFSTLNCEDKKELIFDYSLKLGCLSKEFYTQKFLKDLDEVAELDITRIDPGLFDNTIDDCMPGLEPSVIDCNGDYTFLNLWIKNSNSEIGTRWGVYYMH